MNKRYNNTIDQDPDDVESAYIGVEDAVDTLDFGGLFSHKFTNISLLYRSPNGPAEIYTATRYGKRYILKCLKTQYRNDPIYTMAMAKEFEIGIQLDHPNIRRTVGFESMEEIGQVIVLEYVDGCTLDSLIASGNMSVSLARTITRQIADALQYIHTKQVFHRDLKPSNILISHHGSVVKIIDFNLSDSDDFIVLKNPAGSKKYMAPEQLSGSDAPSAVADIYSLGVVMDELSSVTGDDALAQTAHKCMNPQPDKRPQSVSLIKFPTSRISFTESLSNFISSRLLTYIMICICIVLVVTIILLLKLQ